MASLRERKKAETRQRIADVGTALFVARGFDNVTVAEVADAAGVSKVTVFNYFPRKEDIFFDRVPEAKALLTDALRDREPDETPVAALRRLFVRLAVEHHPLGGFDTRYATFVRTLLGSPALRARAREAADEVQDHLATLLTEAGTPDPTLTAALVMAAERTAYTAGMARVLAGEDVDRVTADHVKAVDHAFDLLATGLR